MSRSPVTRCLEVPRLMRAANDNGRVVADNAVLCAALGHFALHGLGAAAQARKQADVAAQSGDQECYREWLAICRMLDRRAARRS
ncbi:MAG: hypothetical protein V4579_05620 [Pseudomonadota bacterium]